MKQQCGFDEGALSITNAAAVSWTIGNRSSFETRTLGSGDVVYFMYLEVQQYMRSTTYGGTEWNMEYITWYYCIWKADDGGSAHGHGTTTVIVVLNRGYSSSHDQFHALSVGAFFSLCNSSAIAALYYYYIHSFFVRAAECLNPPICTDIFTTLENE